MAKKITIEPNTPPGVKFFATPAKLRAWLVKNHATASELWVGLYKKGTGKASVIWPEVVDQALCFGWIDGIRKSIDSERYMNRITPRKPRSNWSVININRVAELDRQGLMTPPGLKAFAARTQERSGIYSYEQRQDKLEPKYEKIIKSNAIAWKFWRAQTPTYRKTMGWWIVSAKQESTRLGRLTRLVEESVQGRKVN